jgi:hypothetical protein
LEQVSHQQSLLSLSFRSIHSPEIEAITLLPNRPFQSSNYQTTIIMLFRSLSLIAILASSALAAPASPPSYKSAATTTIASAPAAYTTSAPAPYASKVPGTKIAPAYTAATDSYTIVQTLHTDVFRWTAAMSSSRLFPLSDLTHLTLPLIDETRDAYAACTSDEDRAVYKAQLTTQFNSLQTCLQSAQVVLQKQSKHSNDPKLVNPVQDCVQEIKFTGDGLIPILGRGE